MNVHRFWIAANFLALGCAGSSSKAERDSAGAAPEPVVDESDSGVVDEVEDDAPGEFSLAVGQMAPDFTLPDADGNLVSLSDYRGSRVLVMGNAEWCPGCQDLTEKIQEWYQNGAEPDQEAISILIEDSTGDIAGVEDAAAWRDRFELTFPVLADVDRQWRSSYSIEGDLPQRTYLVVDSSGVIAWLQADGERARRRDLVDAINAAD